MRLSRMPAVLPNVTPQLDQLRDKIRLKHFGMLIIGNRLKEPLNRSG
jgi:hypothetical protein